MKRSHVWLCAWIGILGMGWIPASGQEATYNGRRLITASLIAVPPAIDGTASPAEWSAATPVHVEFNQPDVPPGTIPALIADRGHPPPDSEDDLSFDFQALYDDLYLYVAVVVRDDAIFDDSSDNRWQDDFAELGFDGDRRANDIELSGETFLLACDVGGDRSGWHADEHDWIAAVGRQATGYTVEFRISLNMIDTVDGDGEKPPEPGDHIGFNAAVNDDDDGEEGYRNLLAGKSPPMVDSYGIWSATNRTHTDEWGYLYFDPTPAETAVGETTWGSVKQVRVGPSK